MTKLGGIDVRQLYAQRVTVHGKEPVFGLMACLPGSMIPPERQGRAFGFEDVVIDTGLGVERLKQLVSVGDFVTFEQPLRKLAGDIVVGKALDNRACVTIVTHALMALQDRPHAWDVVATATVTEETNMMGGAVAGYGVNPDVAVALDVSFASQPGATGHDTMKMGEGPILDIGVNVHPKIFEALKEAAGRIEMKTGTLPHARSSGTEARVIQLARAGIPTGLVSVAIRNMHTVVETADLRDLGRASRLLTEFVVGLDETILEEMQAALFLDE